jgi:hypothetical protein
LPQIVGRAVARRSVKKAVIYGTKEAMGVQRGSVESFSLDVAGVVWEATERADTRCWGLLPSKIQVLRLELPVGQYPLSLAPHSARGTACGPAVSADVTIQDGRNSYVLATFPGPQIVGKVLVAPP